MKKSVVNSFLGEKVKVKCDDNDEYIGILEKGTCYEEGYYHCKQEINGRDNHWFRSSHIKSISRRMNSKTLEEYSVYSAFDIKKHQETFINYLEVLILEDGTVEYAVPSHQGKALDLACKKFNKTKKEIEDMCPREYYCDYLNWLLGITGSISVWGNCAEHFIVYKTINKKQIATLKKLKKHGLYKGDIPTV